MVYELQNVIIKYERFSKHQLPYVSLNWNSWGAFPLLRTRVLSSLIVDAVQSGYASVTGTIYLSRNSVTFMICLCLCGGKIFWSMELYVCLHNYMIWILSISSFGILRGLRVLLTICVMSGSGCPGVMMSPYKVVNYLDQVLHNYG